MAVERRWAMMAMLVTGFLLQSSFTQADPQWFDVGDKYGWTFPPNAIASYYDDWAKQYTFHVNDTLFFMYKYHSVLEVSKADAASCTIKHPINSYVSKANATVTLDRVGYYAFVCGEASHCIANMKFELNVLAPGQVAAPSAAPEGAAGPGSEDVPTGAPTPSVSADGKNGVSSLRAFPAVILAALLAGCVLLFL